jgi:hypothetical protein
MEWLFGRLNTTVEWVMEHIRDPEDPYFAEKVTPIR